MTVPASPPPGPGYQPERERRPHARPPASLLLGLTRPGPQRPRGRVWGNPSPSSFPQVLGGDGPNLRAEAGHPRGTPDPAVRDTDSAGDTQWRAPA